MHFQKGSGKKKREGGVPLLVNKQLCQQKERAVGKEKLTVEGKGTLPNVQKFNKAKQQSSTTEPLLIRRGFGSAIASVNQEIVRARPQL